MKAVFAGAWRVSQIGRSLEDPNDVLREVKIHHLETDLTPCIEPVSYTHLTLPTIYSV